MLLGFEGDGLSLKVVMKSSLVPPHFHRFPLMDRRKAAFVGCDHANYTARQKVAAETLLSLVADLA